MSTDFLDALQQIAREKEISAEDLLETVEQALVSAYKKNFVNRVPQYGEIKVRINRSDASFRVYSVLHVVDDDAEDPGPNDIIHEEAVRLRPGVKVGDVIEEDVTPHSFGRIAAQAAKQAMVQKLRESERTKLYEELSQRVGEVVTGEVQRRDKNNYLINLGKVEAVLPVQEQVPTEPYRFHDRIKVYILEVRNTNKGPLVTVSRTHPALIRRLFELEVPEINDGIVTIKAVAREPGARSKIAVCSRDERVDPVGSCVGHRGTRVQAVVNELYDEKIDIIRWSEDTAQFIAEALSPAKVAKVTLDESSKSALVVVPDNLLSLAIGRSGQNVRLAARLTGWRIDIRSESQMSREALLEATGGAAGESAYQTGMPDEGERQEAVHMEHEVGGSNGTGPDEDLQIVADAGVAESLPGDAAAE
jgi:N utilization substance protein A